MANNPYEEILYMQTQVMYSNLLRQLIVNGIAGKIEYYILDMHPYTTEYYLTEPSPGIFYLLYGAGNS